MKAFLFRVVLAMLALCLLPAALEFGLWVAGYGEPTTVLVDSPDPDQEVRVDNLSFTVPFFSQSLKRTPAPMIVPKKKPENELRIVVLGASAAMGDPMPEFGLPRMLQAVLESGVSSGKAVRVINAAMTAINSHVVRVMPDDVMKVEPDAVVIYLGNNEMVGPFGPGTIFSGFYEKRNWIKAAVWVRQTRTGQWFSSLKERFSSRGGAVRQWQGMEMFLAGQFDAEDPSVRIARKHFRDNLSEVVDKFRAQDVPVILSTVAVNLDRFPPLQKPESDDSYLKGRQSEEAGDLENAWAHFKTARDNDRLRFRADSEINELIRNVARQHDITFVDAEKSFRDLYLGGTPGSELYVDHVHFTFTGNFKLARLLARAMTNHLPIDEAAIDSMPESMCRQRLAYSPWAESATWELMKERFLRPIFRNQPNHKERMIAIDQAKLLVDHVDKEKVAQEWISVISSNLVLHPDDPDLLMWRGRFYLNDENYAAAYQDFLAASSMWPHRTTPRGYASFAHTLIDGPAAAIKTFKETWLGPAEQIPEIIFYLGELLRDNGRYQDALAWFIEGVSIDPDYPGMLTQRGYVMLKLGNPHAAIPIFEEALKLNPEDSMAWSYLGVAYGEKKYWRKALHGLKKAVDLAPDNSGYHYTYAVGLEKDGRLEEAEREYRETLSLNPMDLDAGVRCINIYWNLADLTEAVSVYEGLRDYYPDLPMLEVQAAMIQARMGKVDQALSKLTSVQDKIPEKHIPLVQAIVSWLVASSDNTSSFSSDTLASFLASKIGSASSNPNVLMLIRPAVLLHLGRLNEASQELQSARIFLPEPKESVATFIKALRLAARKNVAFDVPADLRTDDPVLLELWDQLPR